MKYYRIPSYTIKEGNIKVSFDIKGRKESLSNKSFNNWKNLFSNINPYSKWLVMD